MLDLRSLLEGMPSALQYVIVLGLVMVLLYAALWLTRRIGSHFSDSEKVNFDDPEKYADEVPDLFATTEFRKKKPEGGEGAAQEHEEKP